MLEVVQFYEASPGKHLICVYDIYIYITVCLYYNNDFIFLCMHIRMYIYIYVYNILIDKIMTNI